MEEIIIEKNILGEVKKANKIYGLVKKGDRILVGLSGGKDSIAMVHLFKYYQEKLRIDFKFKVVVIHYGSKEEDKPLNDLKEYFSKYGVEVEIFKTNLLGVIEKNQNKGKSICSFVARMRRGALNKKAIDWGANKLALGQHLDDAVETFFMSLTYGGRLRSMAPKYRAKNGLEVIRPLIWVRENNLIKFVDENKIKTIGNEFCVGLKGDKKAHVREEMKSVLVELEKKNKFLFSSVKNAMRNPDLNALFIVPEKKIFEKILEKIAFWKK